MKPFNLELAKKNHPVQTRDGRPARIICYDAMGIGDHSIVALVPVASYEVPILYSLNGRYQIGYEDDGLDLVMAPTQEEEKPILPMDLCARIPFGVQVAVRGLVGGHILKSISVDHVDVSIKLADGSCRIHKAEFCNIMPYLRPMSSMTDEEASVYANLWDMRPPYGVYPACDYLNERMFDFRGLIEKGLALEAPEGMYKL